MDRNSLGYTNGPAGLASLSARRAWIEMYDPARTELLEEVALRKESVDRNIHDKRGTHMKEMSLSARRAWIEIAPPVIMSTMSARSLSARRAWIEMA